MAGVVWIHITSRSSCVVTGEGEKRHTGGQRQSLVDRCVVKRECVCKGPQGLAQATGEFDRGLDGCVDICELRR